MTDRIRAMQKNLEKHLQKRIKATEKLSNAPTGKKGLLARTGVKNTVTAKQSNDAMGIVADYITDLRQYRQEILNGKKTTV